MKTTLLLVMLLATAGCASSRSETPPTKWSEGKHDERYPYSEIEKVYETVLSAMLPEYFGDDHALAKEHQGKLEAFVRTSFPPSKFCDMMVSSDETKAIFDRALVDSTVCDTPEFQRAFEVTVNVSVQMGMIIFAGRFDTYGAKFIHPNETTAYLFSLTTDPEQEDYIAWVSGEASVDEARKELGADLDYQDGDRFFMFSSPEWYWQQLAGRQGYLQVRGGRIIGQHVIILN